MDIQYYPGCTLHERAKQLDIQGRKIAEVFGYNLKDIPNWTCCGAVYPNSLRNIMKFAAPYRMLAKAGEKAGNSNEDQGEKSKLVVLCSACFNILRRSNLLFRTNSEINQKLADYTEVHYDGNVEVMHYLEFLRDVVTFKRISDEVKKRRTLEKNAVAPYYGCLLLRPYDELKFDDPENPSILADLIKVVDDEAVDYPMQNSCCGSYRTVYGKQEDRQYAEKLIDAASSYGANKLLTSCPLCYYNLSRIDSTKVLYFTDYLASALGING